MTSTSTEPALEIGGDARRTARLAGWTSTFPLPQLLLALYVGLVLATFLGYGISWDEEWHATYGGHVVRWYTSLFQDRSALEYWMLVYYGGFFDTIADILARISPLGFFETRHLLSALLGVLGVIATYKLAAHLGGRAAGLTAALFLALTPAFHGQMFVNPKDIPFAVLFAWSMYYIILSIDQFPRLSRELAAKLAVTIGLTLGVRVGGLILLGYFALAFILWVLWYERPWTRAGAGLSGLTSALLPFGKTFLVVALAAYALMLVWWPWAQTNPILAPIRAFRRFSQFGHPAEMFFEGANVNAAELPWHYLSKWFLITLPEFYFLGLLIGLGLTVTWIVRQRSSGSGGGRLPEYLVLVGWIVLPIAYASASHATLYDGNRHFLFVVPGLAVVCGIGVAKLFTAVYPRPLVAVAASAVVASMALTALDMVKLHPYEYVFFNRSLGGGLKQAAASFETEYWGISYREGVEWVKENALATQAGQKIRVASCGWPLSTSYYLPADRFEYLGSYHYPHSDTAKALRAAAEGLAHLDRPEVGSDALPDIFLATPRWGCHQVFHGEVVHVVSRDDTPLLYVKQIGERVAWRDVRPEVHRSSARSCCSRIGV